MYTLGSENPSGLEENSVHEQQGFTLFELIITLAIAAVIVGVAAPSFSTMIQDNRLSAQSLDFVAALNLARSEAIKRRVRVTLCMSTNGQDCTNAGNWGQGWIVFVDNNGNRIRENGAPDDIILRIHGALAGNNRLTGNVSIANAITYLPSGDTAGPGNGTLALCDSRNDDALSPAIVINITGRPLLTRIDQTAMTCV